jgi:hypothetical protein
MPYCQSRSTLRPNGCSCRSALQDATQWKPSQMPHQFSPFCRPVPQRSLRMCLEDFSIVLRDFSSNRQFHTPPALYLLLLLTDDIIKSMDMTKCHWPFFYFEVSLILTRSNDANAQNFVHTPRLIPQMSYQLVCPNPKKIENRNMYPYQNCKFSAFNSPEIENRKNYFPRIKYCKIF